MLQNVLVSQGAHIGGLNPKSFRTYKSWRKLQSNPARSIIDGELVYYYLYLPINEKLEVSRIYYVSKQDIYLIINLRYRRKLVPKWMNLSMTWVIYKN